MFWNSALAIKKNVLATQPCENNCNWPAMQESEKLFDRGIIEIFFPQEKK